MNAGVSSAVVAAVGWGTASFLAGQACRRGRTAIVLLVTQLAGLVTMLVVTGWQLTTDAGVNWAAWSEVLPSAAVAGVAEMLGFAALYRALANGPMGIATPVAGLGVVVPVVFGMSTGSGIGHWQLLGLLLAAVGILLLGSDRASVGSRNLGLAAASGLAFGVALVALAQGAAVDEVASGTVMRLITVPVLLVVCWIQGRPGSRFNQRSAPLRPGAISLPLLPEAPLLRALPWVGLAIAAGSCDALGNLAFAMASTRMPLPAASLIASMDPVVTALLARIFIAERLRPAGRWGAAAAVLGAALSSTG